MNYLSTRDDRIVAAQGLKLIRKIMLETKLLKYGLKDGGILDDEELVTAGVILLKQFHPVGCVKWEEMKICCKR